MSSWTYSRITNDELFPRQFEYHPHNSSILFGCLNGDVHLHNTDGRIENFGCFGANRQDVVLGKELYYFLCAFVWIFFD